LHVTFPHTEPQPQRVESLLQHSELDWLDLDSAERFLSRDRLAVITAGFAARADLWRDRARHDPESRWFERILLNPALEVWLIGWAPGQWTPLHDHAGAAGALTVAEGQLTEVEFPDGPQGERRRRLHSAPATVAFETHHIHRVGNRGDRNATSIHAYSPPDLLVRTYDETRLLRSLDASAEWEAAF
jgi:predicted metal-dependent enzyme (double-stranded beta helix superfamily)